MSPAKGSSARARSVFRRGRMRETSELVLACLVLLERSLERNVLPLSTVHRLLSQVDPPASRFLFIETPVPYSVELTDLLDTLSLAQKLDRFTIFDDGNHPQTVYRLTPYGRSLGSPWTSRLPPSAEKVAKDVSAEAIRNDVDREVKLVESLERALTSPLL